MAARTGASGRYLRRTANLPLDTAFTMAAWVYIHARTAGAYQYIFELGNATTSSTAYSALGWNSGDAFRVESASTGTAMTAPTVGNWYFFYLRDNGTNLSAGYRGLAATSFTTATQGSSAAFTEAVMHVGNDSYDEWFDGSFSGIRVWDAHLTDAELEAEYYRLTPARTANLNIWTPGIELVASGVNDWSGNGRNWTVGGTLSDYTPAPVPYGAQVIHAGKAAAGGPITVNLSGIASAASLGTLALTAGQSLTLSGAAAAASLGTVTIAAGASLTLTGVSVTTALGALSLTAGQVITLSGIATTGQLGTLALTAGQSLTLTGASASTVLGALAVTSDVLVALSGLSGTSALGTLVAEVSGLITVSLTGVGSTVSLGTLNISSSAIIPLGGVSVNTSLGTLLPGVSYTVALSGDAGTVSLGTLTVSSGCAVVLNGIQVSVGVGSVGVSSGVYITLTGLSATGQLGTIVGAVIGVTETGATRIITVNAGGRILYVDTADRTIIVDTDNRTITAKH